jgi:predicted MFS family arabinose efflux permease
MMYVLNAVACVIFAGALNTRVIDPVIPEIGFAFGVDPATAALLSTAFAVPYALMQPVLGAMADTFGKARMTFVCLVVIVISAFVAMTATNFTVMVAARMVSGAAAGGLFPIGMAIVGDLVPLRERQVAMGRLLQAVMLGNILGASAAGALADLAGWRAVFLATALVGLAAMAIAVVALRGVVKDTPAPFELRTQFANFRTIFEHPLAKVCFGAVFLEGMFLFGVFPHMAALLYAGGEERASIAGIVIAGFGIGGMLYTFVVSLLVKHVTQRRLMLYGGFLMGLGLALIAIRAPWQVELAIFVLFGFAFYLLHGPIQVHVTELAPQARGTAAAFHAGFFFLGQAAGPVYYKYGFAWLDTAPTMAIAAVVLALTGIWSAVTLGRRRKEVLGDQPRPR